MGLDMMIPFGVLVAMVVYFMYTRASFERQMLQDYEKKYDNWKKHASVEKIPCKKLVGLVFEEEGKLSVEVFEEQAASKMERKKYSIEYKCQG